jgi:surface-anchored protein
MLTGLTVALIGGLAVASAQTAGITHTTLSAEPREVGGRTITVYAAKVETEDGKPATGAVSLVEVGQAQGRAIAGAALDSAGNAEIRFDSLPGGDHTLRAVYAGDPVHAASASSTLAVHAETSAVPSFALGIAVVGGNSSTMNIDTPGEAGSLTATVTPAGGFTGFISLSCSGPPATVGTIGGSSLPVGVSCTFTPLNLQVTSANPVSAQMTLQTTAAQRTSGQLERPGFAENGKLALAILLPGIAGLGFLGRKRKLLFRALLLLLAGTAAVLGTSSCSARYRYLNHGPNFDGTDPGTYTMTITAQTSNGVTASSQSQTLTLVVK